MLLFCILVIRNCFEFRISSFEFNYTWRPLRESSFFRFRNPKFNRKIQICLIRIKNEATTREKEREGGWWEELLLSWILHRSIRAPGYLAQGRGHEQDRGPLWEGSSRDFRTASGSPHCEEGADPDRGRKKRSEQGSLKSAVKILVTKGALREEGPLIFVLASLLNANQTYLIFSVEFWITESEKRRLALWNSASGKQLNLGQVGIPRGELQRRKGRQV